MTTAYSYIRFSSKSQATGNSMVRQMGLATAYCEHNNLTLDTTLKLHDLGVSAFKGLNATEGHLAAFLQACDTGIVKKGSYCLVENFDRLSREKFRKAFSLFNSILDRDIVLVTLFDGKKYDKNSDFLDIVYAIMIMQRANEESETKSIRGRTAWAAKHLKAEQLKIPKTTVCPQWLRVINNKFEIIESEADKIRNIFKLYLAGYGYNAIQKMLIQQDNKYYVSNLQKLINNKAVIGTGTRKIYEVDTNGRKTKKVKELVVIENYYPPIISPEDWAQVQMLKLQRSNGGGGRRSSEFNLLTHLCKCSKCGGPMIRINNSSKANKDGKYISLVCKTGKSGATKCGTKSWRLTDLEPLVLNIVNELDIASILGDDTQDNIIKDLRNNIAVVENELMEAQKQLSNIADAIAEGRTFPALLKKADELGIKEPELIKQLDQLKQQLNVEINKTTDVQIAKDNIKLLQENIDEESTRVAINAELKKIIGKIDVDSINKTLMVQYVSGKIKQYFGKDYTLVLPAIDATNSDDYFDQLNETTIEKL